ncbi:hypothetical protein [Nocardioides sp. GY 10127]|uniref:hypothetical protein n=1 Tax=Nocardioides sp. GY 10127 TaxID=2569762 RepID=UPI0010A779D7|nr:hypothetical protein [Nocardioides sp. GY 10127]TIC80003.1 hypothetical protein E8D37_15310 [Nocardioides sp. GY 10127]
MLTLHDGPAPRLDVTIVPREAERLLGFVTDRRQRLMLENFRRHGMYEVAGRWTEILDPALTVEHPVYRVADGPSTEVFDGMEAVRGFYGGMTDAGLNVLFPIWERMAVSDWGIAFESQLAHVVPGELMAVMGHEVEDTSVTYLLSQRVSNVWPFNDEERPRLLGEHVYLDQASAEAWVLPEEHVVTPKMATEALSPLVDALPPYTSL